MARRIEPLSIVFEGKRVDGKGMAEGDLHHLLGRVYIVKETAGWEVDPSTVRIARMTSKEEKKEEEDR